jgi:SAM-dependent methyltransferase
MTEIPPVSAAHNLGTARSTYPGDEALFAELFGVEDRHFWFVARNRVIGAALRRVAQQFPGGCRALEIGCGTGNVLRVLEHTCGPGNVVGMDLFSGGLQYARKRTQCALVQADMYCSPFSAQFDLVGMFDVIEHLADDVAALRQAGSLLQPQGKLLLTVPAHMSLWSYADQFAGHRRRYTRSELAKKLDLAGFEVEYLTYYMTVLWPIMWLSRRLASWIHREHDKQPRELFLKELRPISIVNGPLRWILEKEAIPIAAGRKLPFGTSLLAVGSKRTG